MNISVGDCDYEIEIDHFVPGTRASRWYPGDPGEVEIGRFVTVSFASGFEDVITLDTFLLEFASERGISLAKARSRVEDLAFEYAMDAATDSWADYEAA